MRNAREEMEIVFSKRMGHNDPKAVPHFLKRFPVETDCQAEVSVAAWTNEALTHRQNAEIDFAFGPPTASSMPEKKKKEKATIKVSQHTR